MEIENRRIWQQGSGDGDRTYGNLCVDWGVILNGPAQGGPWTTKEEYSQKQICSAKKLSDLKRFCEDMQDSDLVILRRGMGYAVAVGEIVGGYEYHEEFNDVDGWDIGHVRRVHWLWSNIVNPKKFDSNPFKWGDTTQLLSKRDSNNKVAAVYDWLESLRIPKDKFDSSLVQLPDKNEEIKFDEIFNYLFENGVASASISNLIDDIGEFIRIAQWYRRNGGPSEQETVNYLVVPLLRSLGWTPQKMAVEWNKIDIALFSSLPRNQEFLTALVEVKKMDKSCLTAFDQAKNYALQSEHCEKIIVTDGMRYGIFIRTPHDSSFVLYAYMNLLRLRRSCSLYKNCKGAQDAILAMSADFQVGFAN